MVGPKPSRYDVFLSYSSDDAAEVATVQKYIESYRPPKGLVSGSDDLRVRCFRDKSDQGVDPDYLATFKGWIDRIPSFLLIGSSSSFRSEPVRTECAHFLNSGRRTMNLAVLEGEPKEAFPENVLAAFPRAIYADLRTVKKGGKLRWWLSGRRRFHREILRLLSSILSAKTGSKITFELLVQRDRQRRIRRRIQLSAGVFAVALLFVGVWVWQEAEQSRQANRQRIATFVDLGRNELFAGNESRAVVYLSEAYRLAESLDEIDDSLRLLLGRAMRPIDALVGEIQTDQFDVTSLAFSPDGTRIATGGQDGTACIWDVQTGDLVARCGGHESDSPVGASIYELFFSPDGSELLTNAFSDDPVRTWDAATGAAKLILEREGETVRGGRWLGDGKQILCVSSIWSWDEEQRDLITIRAFDSDTGEPVYIPATGHDAVRSATLGPAVSSDGARAVTAGSDGTLILWDLRTDELIQQNIEWSVGEIAFSANDNHLFATEDNARILRVLDAKTLNVVKTAEFEAQPWLGDVLARQEAILVSAGKIHLVHAAEGPAPIELEDAHEPVSGTPVTSSDERFIAAGGEDGGLMLWSTHSGKLIAHWAAHQSSTYPVAFSPDASVVATTDRGIVRLWSTELIARYQPIRAAASPITSFDVAPDGWRVVVSTKAGEVAVVHLMDRTVPPLQAASHDGGAMSVAFHPSGSRILSAGRDGVAHLSDAATGGLIRSFVGPGESLRTAKFSTDGARVLTVGDNQQAAIWNTETDVQLHLLRGVLPNELRIADSALDDGIFAPSSNQVVTTGYESLMYWDVETGKRIREEFFMSPLRMFGDDGISSDGKWLMVSDGRGGHRVDLDTGMTVQLPRVHEDVVWADFSSDDSLLVTTGADRRVVVWNTASFAHKPPIEHRADVLLARFSPDDSLMVIIVENGEAYLAVPGNQDHLLDVSGHAGKIRDARFTPDCSKLITAGEDGYLHVWELPCESRSADVVASLVAERSLWRLEGDQLQSTIDDEAVVVTTPDDQGVTDWTDETDPAVLSLPMAERVPDLVNALGGTPTRLRWAAGSYVHEPGAAGHIGIVADLALSPDGRLFSCAEDQTVRIWDAATGAMRGAFSVAEDGYGFFDEPQNLEVTQDVLLVAKPAQVELRDPVTGELISTFDEHHRSSMGLLLAVAPDGAHVLSGDEELLNWDVRSGKVLAALIAPEEDDTDPLDRADGLVAIDFFADGRAFTARGDGRMSVWDLNKGAEESHYQCELDNYLMDATYAPTSGLAVTVTEYGDVQVWSLRDERRIRRFGGHDYRIRSADFAPDGIRVASRGAVRQSPNSAVVIWNAQTFEVEEVFHLIDDWPSTLEWSPDGDAIFVGTGKGIVFRVDF